MIPNHTSLAQVRKMTVTELAQLPTDQLANLLEDAASLKADAAILNDKLSEACHAKFGSKADAERKTEGKQTGRVSLDEGAYIVRADLPKKVEWEQELLTEAIRVIRDEWKEKPGDYVSLKVVVEERKYEAWPPAIRKLFEPARTLGTGKPSYKIERRAA